MIRRIDAAVLACCQQVVDATQQQPAWLARQCAILWAVLVCVRYAVAPMPAWLLALALLASMGMVALTVYAAAMLPVFSRIEVRIFMVVLTLPDFVVLAVTDDVGKWLLITLADTCLTAIYYFAACRPPRPRLPRHSLASQGG